tara:strand:+ start:39 stop:518 length:480 start_codon:yes stop_codon:yes gene_type:complete
MAAHLTASGLAFPASQAASAWPNDLDDYEEGTFAFSITPSSGSVGLNSGYDTGSYIKVGRLVHIQGNLGLSSGSGTGVLQLTLPFASGNLTDEAEAASGGIGTYSVDFASANSTPVWELQAGGATTLFFKCAVDNSVWGDFNFSSGDYFIFSIQYISAT